MIQHVREKVVCSPAKRSPSHRLPRTRLRVDAQGPNCSPISCPPSTACTCRSIVRAMSTNARASTSMYRRSRTGVGASAATLMPLVDAIRSQVFAAERIHAEDNQS